MFWKKKAKKIDIKYSVNTIENRIGSDRPNGFIIGNEIAYSFVIFEVKELLMKHNDIQVILIDDEKKYNNIVKELGGEVVEFTEKNSYFEYDEMFNIYVNKKFESNNRLILFDTYYPKTELQEYPLWLYDFLTLISKSDLMTNKWIYINNIDEVLFFETPPVKILWENKVNVITGIVDSFDYIYNADIRNVLLANSGYYLVVNTCIRDSKINEILTLDDNMLNILDDQANKRFGIVSFDGKITNIFEM